MGNNGNIPIKPDAALLLKIDALLVDTEKGRVYSKRGGQIGCIGAWRGGRCRINIRYKGRCVSIPRYFIIWYRHHGVWPSTELDHRDQNKINDAINNLEEVTNAENTQRAKASGLPKNIQYDNFSKSYRVRKQGLNGVDLGRFETLEKAVEAAKVL